MRFLACATCFVLVASSACRRDERASADADVVLAPGPAAASVAVKIVDLPKAETYDHVVMMFAVDIGADGALSVNGVGVKDTGELVERARAEAGRAPEARAVIRADKATPYGRVIEVMDALKRGGIGKLAFAVDPSAPAPVIPLKK